MVDHRRELRICSHVACIVKDWESRLGHRLQSALAHFRSAPSLSVGRLTVVGRFCTRAPARLHLARRKHASIKLLFAKRQREVLDTRAMRVRSTIRGLYSFLTMYRDLSFFSLFTVERTGIQLATELRGTVSDFRSWLEHIKTLTCSRDCRERSRALINKISMRVLYVICFIYHCEIQENRCFAVSFACNT